MNNNTNTLENQVVIEKISHDGRGIVSVNGKKVFIDGALEGETVLFDITKKHRRYNEAKVASVLEPSANRVDAICESFLTCGGCSYQHMSSSHQLLYKQNIVIELLEHFGEGVKPKEWLKPLQANTNSYRTKARLGVKYVTKKEKLLIGFREKSSSFIADMNSCSILTAELNNLLQPLEELIASLSIYNQVPQVEFAMGDNTIAVIIRNLAEFNQDDINKLKNFSKNHNIYLYIQPKGPDSLIRLDNNNLNKLSYQFNYTEKNIDILYHFEPHDFTQVNLSLNNLMLKQALDLLELQGHEQVLDLFCGLGNFSLPIAKALTSGSVLGVEGSQEMVKRAYDNAEFNNINNVEFLEADLYNTNETSIVNNIFDKKFDCIVLDPPRSGAKELLPLINKVSPSKILYVSCDPATFARDVGILCNQFNYKFKVAGIMDMFPHTKHVETMGLLVK